MLMPIGGASSSSAPPGEAGVGTPLTLAVPVPFPPSLRDENMRLSTPAVCRPGEGHFVATRRRDGSYLSLDLSGGVFAPRAVVGRSRT
jgi:hypothetical protein